MALNVVMLGPPGAGKGTQSERFARTHGLPKISTGDILREAIHADTPLGRSAKATIYSGGLVGDDVMISMPSSYIFCGYRLMSSTMTMICGSLHLLGSSPRLPTPRVITRRM